ncbi:hypothetical protein [uncultured Chryseobacterium sp.]|uniref:hypothetical protein n=1 Tax=uncultured Chryseobacterium sp. TaxID=259322 RepID=UPI0025CF48AC|nr:hypothetical protein [uncultured Chryseobacterium sp.]
MKLLSLPWRYGYSAEEERRYKMLSTMEWQDKDPKSLYLHIAGAIVFQPDVRKIFITVSKSIRQIADQSAGRLMYNYY